MSLDWGDDGRVEVRSNGVQTLVHVDYGTVQVVATVNPCTTTGRVEDAVVAAGRELILALNGPTPKTLFTLPESTVTDICEVARKEVAHAE